MDDFAKVEDTDMFDLTLNNFIKEPLPTDGYGMVPVEEQVVVEPAFKAPVSKRKI